MTKNKKLGLLLLPLMPLSAIGIVEVANTITTPAPEVVVAQPHRETEDRLHKPSTSVQAPAVSTQPVIPPALPKG